MYFCAMKHIVVIGAGAAGMVAAGTAAEQGAKVTLIEKMPKPGRKIAITGKGRCNLTNLKEWNDFAPHVHPVNRYFKPAFYAFTSADVVAFFNSIGLPTKLERGSRVYPASERAFDVIDTLVRWLNGLGVEVLYNTAVTGLVMGGELTEIRAENVGESQGGGKGPAERQVVGVRVKKVSVLGAEVVVQAEEREIAADGVVVATGGMSYPGTGSTGDGYAFAEQAGHRIEPIFPSLTALMPASFDRRLEGVQLRNVALELHANGSVKQTEEGEVHFTDLGIEGPIGFRVSRKAVQALIKGHKVALRMNLKPALSREQLMVRWERENGTDAVWNIDALEKKVRSFLPKELVKPFADYVRKGGTAGEGGLHPVDALQDWVFPIAGYEGWRRAVVTAGGVSMKEVDAKTMRSRLVDNLYFAGEVLDIDADSGGYNLQVAFATGRMAGVSVLANKELPASRNG